MKNTYVLNEKHLESLQGPFHAFDRTIFDALWFNKMPKLLLQSINKSLQLRHNQRNGVSNHRRFDCVLNHLFRRMSNKTPKLHRIGLCEGNPPVTKGGKYFHLMMWNWIWEISFEANLKRLRSCLWNVAVQSTRYIWGYLGGKQLEILGSYINE